MGVFVWWWFGSSIVTMVLSWVKISKWLFDIRILCNRKGRRTRTRKRTWTRTQTRKRTRLLRDVARNWNLRSAHCVSVNKVAFFAAKLLWFVLLCRGSHVVTAAWSKFWANFIFFRTSLKYSGGRWQFWFALPLRGEVVHALIVAAVTAGSKYSLPWKHLGPFQLPRVIFCGVDWGSRD